jgi:hypothetical protein
MWLSHSRIGQWTLLRAAASATGAGDRRIGDASSTTRFRVGIRGERLPLEVRGRYVDALRDPPTYSPSARSTAPPRRSIGSTREDMREWPANYCLCRVVEWFRPLGSWYARLGGLACCASVRRRRFRARRSTPALFPEEMPRENGCSLGHFSAPLDDTDATDPWFTLSARKFEDDRLPFANERTLVRFERQRPRFTLRMRSKHRPHRRQPRSDSRRRTNKNSSISPACARA